MTDVDLVDRYGDRYRDVGEDRWHDVPAARIDANGAVSRAQLERITGPLREIPRDTPWDEELA